MHISCTVNRSTLRENASWIYWDLGKVLLMHIIDVFENEQQQISPPLQESCRKPVMKFDMTQSITGEARKSNGDAPHVRKPLYTFVKNAMLDSIQIVTSSFTSRSNLIDILVL